MRTVREVIGVRHRDTALAAVLTLAGEAEVLLLGEADGRVAGALALPIATVPLAVRGRHPLLPLLGVTAALVAQGLVGGDLAGGAVVPLLALLVALYTAGRHATGRAGLATTGAAVVAVTAARAAFDPAVERAADVVLTLLAVALPALVGRWVRSQAQLQASLRERALRIARDRERDAREAAEEERVRIVGDLQAAVAGGLASIARRAGELPGLLERGEHDAARSALETIAATAREALADVRRVLGILRREEAPSRAPHDPDPLAGAVIPEVPPATRRMPAAARRRALSPRAADALLAGIVLAGGALEAGLDAGAAAALTAAPIAAPLLVRRRWPVPAVLAVLAAIALQSALVDLGAFPVASMAAVACASYAVGTHCERAVAVAGLVLAAAVATAHAAAFYPSGAVAAPLGGVALPWTVGRIVRGHRRLTREGRERAASEERAREQEARAAVTAERMRIARELHDAVAHNISVIAIQAGGAQGLVARDPARAAEVARLIETVAREAAGELDRLSGALRTAPIAPQPTLARVDALARRAREAGQSVELRVEGEAGDLPAGVDLAAYRIVQEALTNAAKHAGDAHARVVVRYERGAVEVEVADDGRGAAGAPADGGGHGLVGIRERVGLYGGTLDLGPRPDGAGFRVRARLPVGAP